ncbi:MAG TPA: hypothetical protein DCY31_05080 [Ruminococcaceae bacterium]|nr:hypothetical protein [Oscillospiraceae bacterium]
MDHSTAMILSYCIIFSFFNIAVFLMYYIFGFTYDIELRKIEKRIFLPPFAVFLFHFKGVKSSSKTRATRTGGGCEIYALAYLIISEIACFVIAKLSHDLVLPCRISIAAFVISLAAFIFIAIKTKRKIKSSNVAEEIQEITDYLTPKETIDINNSEGIDEFLTETPEENPKPKPAILDALNEGTEVERETADVGEGMEELNRLKENPIEGEIQLIDLNDINAIPDSMLNPNEPDRETTNVSEGMDAINKLRSNPIDNEF